MRQENLTVVKGGLTRLRTKGAALKDSLYELLNGFVTLEKTVKVRPGTILDETLTTGTTGLVSFDGSFHVFASSNILSLPSNYELHILRAPDGAALLKVHFAEPFLGSLYIAAEFVGGAVYHFWLQPTTTWTANTVYDVNELVQPTTANSFNYRATRYGNAYPQWTPGAARTIGDFIEPTVYNGFFFEVEQIFGTNAVSGDTEPDWANVVDGQLINENVDGTIIPPAATPPPAPPPRGVPRDIDSRYSPGGRRIRTFRL